MGEVSLLSLIYLRSEGEGRGEKVDLRVNGAL